MNGFHVIFSTSSLYQYTAENVTHILIILNHLSGKRTPWLSSSLYRSISQFVDVWSDRTSPLSLQRTCQEKHKQMMVVGLSFKGHNLTVLKCKKKLLSFYFTYLTSTVDSIGGNSGCDSGTASWSFLLSEFSMSSESILFSPDWLESLDNVVAIETTSNGLDNI